MKILLHYLYWLVVFTPGLLELMGWHSAIYRVGFPLVGGALFLILMVRSKPVLKVPLFIPLLGFVAISGVSSIYNSQPFYNWSFFLLFTLLSSYLYFLVIVNEKDDKLISRINKCIVALIILQIPVVIVKFLVMGQSESGAIGTISVRAGSISTVFPLLVVAFLSSFYFYTRRLVYLVLIVMFALFAIIGEKRAIVFFLPAEMLLGYILYIIFNKKGITAKMLVNFVVISSVSFLLMVMTVKLVPTLNPERSYWGSVDFEYVLDYTAEYTDSGYFEGDPTATLQEIRRIEGLYYFIGLLMSYDYWNILLGDGAGKLVKSRYSEGSGEMIDVYGVRYGGRMGFIWLLMQVGILGVIMHLSFYMSLVWRVVRMRNLPNQTYSALRLGFIIASLFMFVDFIMYSITSIQVEAVKGVYFYVAALLYRYAYAQRMQKKAQHELSALRFASY